MSPAHCVSGRIEARVSGFAGSGGLLPQSLKLTGGGAPSLLEAHFEVLPKCAAHPGHAGLASLCSGAYRERGSRVMTLHCQPACTGVNSDRLQVEFSRLLCDDGPSASWAAEIERGLRVDAMPPSPLRDRGRNPRNTE